MKQWDQMTFSLQRLWNAVASRLGIRKSGILRLHHDVRSCEYKDVHVMWEMLHRNEAEQTRSPRKSKKRPCWKFFEWARNNVICRSY
ncbi:hypothetical protein LWI28_011657 [Acer negundo]|uniref:Uncharacterized protein n=1 Tax=Acer negundo TaxID=4023 RepID=A0AAD5P5R4_ACENE|nr:hypothetical protein LWI28_011657 [Acer negundo]KAK4859575.1 hypothetical protein QYF36_007855 [Acer negundo]